MEHVKECGRLLLPCNYIYNIQVHLLLCFCYREVAEDAVIDLTEEAHSGLNR